MFKKYNVSDVFESMVFFNDDDCSEKKLFQIGRDNFKNIVNEQTNIAQISSAHFLVKCYR